MTSLDSILKSRDITLPTKIHVVKAMVVPVVMYGCESWTIKKAEHRKIDAFELWCWRRLLRVPWTARRSNKSILKEISPGRTDAEAETPILWLPDAKSWLTGKDPDGGKDWGQEEKGMTKDEMIGWHDRLDGHEFEQVLGVGDGQGSLACCSSWGCKELDMTEWLNWTELITHSSSYNTWKVFSEEEAYYVSIISVWEIKVLISFAYLIKINIFIYIYIKHMYISCIWNGKVNGRNCLSP